MSRQVYVGRLSSRIRREHLQQEFEKFGKIKDIDLRNTHAFIEFENGDDARAAISKMDNKRLNEGSDRITVKSRDDRPQGARGPTSRDVCFNCGRKGHWANECKEGDLRDTCYRCYKKGHIRKDCPKSRTPSEKRSRRDKDRKRRRSSSSSSKSSESSKSRRRYRQQQKQQKKPNRRSPSSSESRSKPSQSSQSSSKQP
ncbi:unnamed protein product [Paramecium primaurelia]|uniref:Uncharacterized protein n=1 Tax=Paramecium primaurelia TaxID=5886 RepID=A0A8S1PI75_PARPR|nr:unnamed protein product [Paramecium primaurelia]